MLIDPDTREVPDLEAFILSARQEHLLVLLPLHLGDGVRVCLQNEDGLLLLEVPDSDDAVGVARNQLSSRPLAPLQTAHSSLTLQINVGLRETFFAGRPKVEDVDRTVLATGCHIVFSLTHR